MQYQNNANMVDSLSEVTLAEIEANMPNLLASKLAVLLLGPPGAGKTAVCLAVGEIMLPYGQKWACLIETTPQLDPPDIRGHNVPVKDPDFGFVTKWTMPSIIQRERACYKAGFTNVLVVYDELPSAGQDTAKAAASPFNEGTIGEFEFHPNTRVWATGNRMEDRAGVNRMMAHIQNRLVVLPIKYDVESHLTWCKRKGVHWVARALIEHLGSQIVAKEVPKEQGTPYCTARSLTKGMMYLCAEAEEDSAIGVRTDEFSMKVLAGGIGVAATAQVQGFLAYKDLLPTLSEVMADPDNAKIPPISNPGAGFAASRLILEAYARENAETLWRYAQRLTKDIAVSVLAEMLSRESNEGKGAVLAAPSIAKFMAANPTIISKMM